MILIVLIWGVNFLVVKATLRQFLPLTFNVFRFLLAATVLLLAAKWGGEDLQLTWREAGHYAMLGFMGVTLYQILFIEGLARTTISNASLINASSPVMIALAIHFLGHEHLRLHSALGTLLAFAGIYLVITGKPRQPASHDAGASGDLLMLAAACASAFHTMLVQHFVKARSVLKVTAYSIVFGTVPLVLWSTPALLSQPWSQVDAWGWAGILFSGLLSIALASLIWNLCIAQIGARRTSIYSNLVPIVALVAGVIFLRERVAAIQTAGALATLSGIALTRRRKECAK